MSTAFGAADSLQHQENQTLINSIELVGLKVLLPSGLDMRAS
jgi:hypothetical protein